MPNATISRERHRSFRSEKKNLHELLDDFTKTPMTITLEAIDGATTGQKVVECYREAGFTAVGTVPADKTGGDWNETIADLVKVMGAGDEIPLREWVDKVGMDAVIMCKKM
jgi:hypothetical protein